MAIYVTKDTLPDLSDHQQLSSVCFSNLFIQEPDVQCAIIMLSRINSRCMATIDLHFLFNLLEDLDDFDWDSLDQILARPNFQGLRSVKLWLTVWASDIQMAVVLIRNSVPLLDHRGILEITAHTSQSFAPRFQ